MDGRSRRTVATGLFDLLQAGSYLVGNGWTDGIPMRRPGLLEPVGEGPMVFEGSVFGTVRDEEIVFWITNHLGTALWVLRGRPDASAATIRGSATYTDAEHASEPPYEAAFELTHL